MTDDAAEGSDGPADEDGPAEALVDHRGFERDGDRFVATTTRFDASVVVEPADDSADRYRLRVTVPTLSTAVAGDDVAPVVEEGWFETFELRMEDAPGATRIDVPEPSVREDDGRVVVAVEFEHATPAVAVGAAKALIEYVEGTYLEGIIPGYEYEAPVADLLQRARRAGGDQGRGPTPL